MCDLSCAAMPSWNCETPESVNSMVDIFVKCLPATTNADTASNVWLMPGGPGQASDSMENMMLTLHSRLNGTVNVYTMDHRGTGRSTFLDYVAAQACTTGSPYSNDIDPIEVASCAQALEFKYGTLAAFSKTSAATDMKTFLSEHSNGASTIVYGVSYGTALVERLMHLNPPNVTGYVLDGISTTTSASTDTFEYFSKWETDFGEVGDYFLGFCAQDSACSAHFTQKTLSTTLQDLLTRFDNDPNSTCATLVTEGSSTWGNSKPSFKLREALGIILTSPKKRSMIPVIVYRLNRCESKDIESLKLFFNVLTNDHNYKSKSDIFYYSNLLFYLLQDPRVHFSTKLVTCKKSTSRTQNKAQRPRRASSKGRQQRILIAQGVQEATPSALDRSIQAQDSYSNRLLRNVGDSWTIRC